LLESLARVSRLCTRRHPGIADVIDACEIVRAAVDGEEAYVVQAGDPYFTRMGDDGPPESYEIKQRGYWLVWRELARDELLIFGGFDVQDRLVMGAKAFEGEAGYTHVACLLPAEESNSEMLVIRGRWAEAISAERRQFLEAVRPILASLVANVLDSKRQARQQEQLKALSQVARAFSEARETDNVLQGVATALAKASGFDWVTLSIANEECSEIVERAMNLARHSETETAAMNLRRDTPREFLRDFNTERRPRIYSDVLTDARITPEMLAYYERAHVLSTALFPILFQDSMLGYITFTSGKKHAFEEPEVDFLSDLVSQAATTIKGVRLYRELEQAREIQHFLARTDTLTGIPNRRYFEEVLRAEFARANRYREPLCVLMADLDYFKRVNDTLGHGCGDEALRHVASVARETCRQSDFVGRWGGDEFVFILPMTPMDGGVTFAERFQSLLVDSPYIPSGRDEPWLMTVSVGVAQTEAPAYATPEAMLEAADAALYQAKEGGRNRVVRAVVRAAAA
jgi:diguanylate cyclase (GGDEF)-like protein